MEKDNDEIIIGIQDHTKSFEVCHLLNTLTSHPFILMIQQQWTPPIEINIKKRQLQLDLINAIFAMLAR